MQKWLKYCSCLHGVTWISELDCCICTLCVPPLLITRYILFVFIMESTCWWAQPRSAGAVSGFTSRRHWLTSSHFGHWNTACTACRLHGSVILLPLLNLPLPVLVPSEAGLGQTWKDSHLSLNSIQKMKMWAITLKEQLVYSYVIRVLQRYLWYVQSLRDLKNM